MHLDVTIEQKRWTFLNFELTIEFLIQNLVKMQSFNISFHFLEVLLIFQPFRGIWRLRGPRDVTIEPEFWKILNFEFTVEFSMQNLV